MPITGSPLRLRAGTSIHGDARRQVALIAAQHGNPQPQIGVAGTCIGAQDVALAQDRGEITSESLSAEFLRLDAHVRETRMHP